jgi:peptidoglycan/xylan/chitin deacetylase (PgdA/CDA1 family)
MKVFLTIDIECYSGDYEAEVWGGRLGLPYLLDSLGRHGGYATFFVEALGARRWGKEPASRICRAIRDGGHEVQLHVHPAVATAWGLEDRYDRLSAYDLATQTDLIQQGKFLLEECQGAPVSIFRAGDLSANEDTLLAMKANGLVTGSNRDLDSHGSIASRLNEVFPVVNDLCMHEGVTDLPVSCFRSPFPRLDGPYRHLQITAVGAGELRSVLMKMERAGYAAATILTHPGEFYSRTESGFAPNEKNCCRWESLLKFLAETGRNPTLVSQIGGAVVAGGTMRPVVKGGLVHGMMRLVEQAQWRMKNRAKRV